MQVWWAAALQVRWGERLPLLPPSPLPLPWLHIVGALGAGEMELERKEGCGMRLGIGM